MTRRATPASRFGVALGALLIALAAFGPWLTRNSPAEQFAESVYAPPMRPHIIERARTERPASGGRSSIRSASKIGSSTATSRTARARCRFALFRDGVLLSVDPAHGSPWFPLGADALGRDQLARLASGARLSLGVALGAALGALVIGALAGGLAGFAGGLLDDGVMRVADVVVALPAVYVVLALRASMPLVLSTTEVFWTMVVVLAARGVAVSGAGRPGGRRRRDGFASTQKLRARSARAVRGYCSVTSCPPPGGSSSCRRRSSCRRSSSPRRRCRLSGWVSASRPQLGRECCGKPDAAGRSSRRPGSWRRPSASCFWRWP